MMPIVVAAMMLLLAAFAVGLLRDLIDEAYDRKVRLVYSASPDDGAFPYPALVL